MAYPLGTNNRIPKRIKSDLMEFVRIDSPDAKEILREAQMTNLVEKDTARIFHTISVWMVRNNSLLRRYEKKKRSLREQGRKQKEVEDRLLFAVESWQYIQKVCKSGASCEKARDVLGDSQFGLHLNRNFDVLLRYTACTKEDGIKFLLVFKAMFGKVKSVTPNLSDVQEIIEPTPNYDTHISNVKPDPTMGVCDAQEHNLAYLYEYDEETTLPSVSPSQILPFAVLSLTRTAQKIDTPLRTIWPGSRNRRQRSFNTARQHSFRSQFHMSPDNPDELQLPVSTLSVQSTSTVSSNIKTHIDEEPNGKLIFPSNKSLYPTSSCTSAQKQHNTIRKSIGEQNKSNCPSEIKTMPSEEQEEVRDLQYTEYLWDPPLDKSPSVDSVQSTLSGVYSVPDSVSEKLLIINRLKEVEMEILSKQNKLQELRRLRAADDKSESLTSDEDLWVNDADVDSIVFSSFKREAFSPTDEPLDLSKPYVSSYMYVIPHQLNVNTTDTEVPSQNQTSGFDSEKLPEINIRQKAYTGMNINIETSAPSDNSTYQSQNEVTPMKRGENILNCKDKSSDKHIFPRDTPTPTLDEPHDLLMRNCENSRLNFQVIHNKEKQLENKSNDTTEQNNERNEFQIEENETLHNDTTMLHLFQSKKCSKFYENYMKKKKRTVGNKLGKHETSHSFGDNTRLQNKTNIGSNKTPVLQDEADSSPNINVVNENREPVPCVELSPTQNFVTQNKQKKDSFQQKPLSDGLNKYMGVNLRDPRIQKRVSQENNKDEPSEEIEKSKIQDRMEDHNSLFLPNYIKDDGDRHMNEPIKSDETGLVQLNIPTSENNDSKDVIQTKDNTSEMNTCSNSSKREGKKSVMGSSCWPYSSSGSDTHINPEKQESGTIHHIPTGDHHETQDETKKKFSPKVEAILEKLENAINVMQKQVVKCDEKKCSSEMSSYEEEEEKATEADPRASNCQNQRAISTIVTERPDFRKNKLVKTPTVVEVSCVKSSSEMFHGILSSNLEPGTCNTITDGHMSRSTNNLEGMAFCTENKMNKETNPEKLDIASECPSSEKEFMPRNRGFSSYLPESSCNSGLHTVSKSFFRDVIALQESDMQTEPLKHVKVKTEPEEGTNNQQRNVEIDAQVIHQTNAKTDDMPVADSNDENNHYSHLSQDWLLSEKINKTLNELKKELPEQYKERENFESDNKRLSNSPQHRKSSRSRSRSKSVNTSETKLGDDVVKSRAMSPIRDPHFVPFHEKGKILTKYFKVRNKRMGLKWVERRGNSPNRFRSRAIQKAKLTLFRNQATKNVTEKTESKPQSNSIKKEPESHHIPVWMPHHTTFRKRNFHDHERKYSVSKFQEKKFSWTNKQWRKPWQRRNLKNPDELIIDRHGMVISLNSPGRSGRFKKDGQRFYQRRNFPNERVRSIDRTIHERPCLRNSDPSSDKTLSKAMTSLLKRVLFDGPRNDGTTEGKMADMVYEMVKKKVCSSVNQMSRDISTNDDANNSQKCLPDQESDLPSEIFSMCSENTTYHTERRDNDAGWDRRKVYINNRQYSASTKENGLNDGHDTRSHDKSEYRTARHYSNDRFETASRYTGRGNWRGRGRGRGSWTNHEAPYFHKRHFVNTWQPPQRGRNTHNSRHDSFRESRGTTTTEFSRRGFHSSNRHFRNKDWRPYKRSDKYPYSRSPYNKERR